MNMNGWDVIVTVLNQFPPVAITLLLIAAVVAVSIGIAGFSKHGMDFIKHGFAQNALGDLIDKLATKEDFEKLETRLGKVETKIENMETRFEKVETKIENMEIRFEKVETKIENMETRFEKVETELESIKVNHFGHLKNFLNEMTSILVDKGVFNHTDKARLDNQLRGM